MSFVPGTDQLNSIPRSKSVLQRNLNLIRELSITQFKLKYTGSALGYVWSSIKSLLLFGVMYLVFSVLLGTGRGTYNFPVQLLVGVVLWTFFVEATTTAMNAIAGAGELIGKAYFRDASLSSRRPQVRHCRSPSIRSSSSSSPLLLAVYPSRGEVCSHRSTT